MHYELNGEREGKRVTLRRWSVLAAVETAQALRVLGFTVRVTVSGVAS